jgi:hypothetical protein
MADELNQGNDALLEWASRPIGQPYPGQPTTAPKPQPEANDELSKWAAGNPTPPKMRDDEAKSHPISDVLTAMGQGASKGWGYDRLGSWADPIMGKPFSEFTMQDWDKVPKMEGMNILKHPGWAMKSFNESFIRPIAQAIAAAPRAFFAGYSGIQGGLAEAAHQVSPAASASIKVNDTAVMKYLGFTDMGMNLSVPDSLSSAGQSLLSTALGGTAEIMDAPFIAANGMATLVGGVRPKDFLKETGRVRTTVDLSKAADENVIGPPRPPINTTPAKDLAAAHLPPQNVPGPGMHYDAITVQDARGQTYGVHGAAAEAKVLEGGTGDAIRIHADPTYMLNLDKNIASHPKMVVDAAADVAQAAQLDITTKDLKAMSGTEFFNAVVEKVGENKAVQMFREKGIVGRVNAEDGVTLIHDPGVVEYMTRAGQDVPPEMPKPHALGADVPKDAALASGPEKEFKYVGNLRIPDFKASEDAKTYIENKALENGGYTAARSGEPSASAYAVIESATGVQASKLREMGLGRRFDNDKKMAAAGEAMFESAENMSDIAKRHELSGATEASKLEFVKGMLAHNALAEHVTGMLGEWGRTGQAIQELYDLKERKSVRQSYMDGKVAEGEKPPVLTPQAQRAVREINKAVDRAAAKPVEGEKSVGQHIAEHVTEALRAVEKEHGDLPKEVRAVLRDKIQDALAHTKEAGEGELAAESNATKRTRKGEVAKAVKDATEGAIRDIADAEVKANGLTPKTKVGEVGPAVSGDHLKDFIANVKNGDDLEKFLQTAQGMTTRDLNTLIKKFAKLDKEDIPSFLEQAKDLVEGQKPRAMDPFQAAKYRFLRAWKNSILAGVLSHVFYMFANQIWFAQEGLHIQGAGVMGVGRRVLEGKEAERVYMSEGMIHIMGGLAGFGNGLANIAKFWKEGEGSTITINKMTMIKPGTGWLGYVQRSLGVLGEIVETQGQFSSLARDAYAEANKSGVKFFSPEFREIMMNNMKYPTKEQMMRAEEYGDFLAHTRALEPKMRQLQFALKQSYWGEFVVPFTTVPFNIVKNATSATPAGFLLPGVRRDLMAGGRAGDLAMSRMVVGGFLMAYLASSFTEDDLTGSGPTDPQSRADEKLTRPMENAIRVGNWWVPYGRMGSTGLILGMSANIRDVIHLTQVQPNAVNKDGELQEARMRAVMAIGDWISEAGLKDVAELMHATIENRNDPNAQRRYISNYMFGFVPFSSMIRQGAGFSDPYLRDSNSFVDDLKNLTPWARTTLSIKRNFQGIPNENPHYLNLLPHVSATIDPVNQEFQRLNLYPALPPKNYNGIKLEPQLYDSYRTKFESLAYPMLHAAVSDPGYAGLSDIGKFYKLHAIVEIAKGTADTWLMLQNNGALIREGIARKQEHLLGGVPYHQRFEKTPIEGEHE